MDLEAAVRKVQDLDSLFYLLRDQLEWPLGESAALEDSTFEWTADDLRVSDGSAARLGGGIVRQLRPFTEGQPWGIFLLEFANDRVYRTALRDVLRRLVPSRRRDPTLPSWRHDNLLFICTTREYQSFTFAHFRGEEAPRAVLTTFGWDKGDTHIRTLCEFNLPALTFPSDGGADAGKWIEAWRSAFDVDRVSRAFYEGYRRVFDSLQAGLRKQTGDANWAHDYALQFLNRLVFLYFVQRKRWLGDDLRFVPKLWSRYKACAEPADSFFDRWLSVLFFEAFNNQFQAGRADRQHLPEDTREALAKAPFLNGGLFTRNDLDDAHAFKVPDSLFEALFDRFNGTSPGFLERYNFTISEDTPLDQEVAVNPEMLGKVYESLVNLSSEGLEEEDRRGTAGIFYTPRVEIDLMCRLALVDRLTNDLGQEAKPLLYRAVFAYTPEEKEAADAELLAQDLWGRLNALLHDITVLDPACGSGSFLVGMLLVLDDLQARANHQLGEDENSYDRRTRIIGHSLYGVDCMEWAVHMAELRLWLQLVIETDLEWYQMKHRALLPNLTFKVRPGDSLVQEIGGVSFSLHRKHLDIPRPIRGRLTTLKGEKLRYYRYEDRKVFHTEDALKNEELAIFSEILSVKEIELAKRVATLDSKLNEGQRSLTGEVEHAISGGERKKIEDEKEAVSGELEQISLAKEALGKSQDRPFVWDIAFVEVFESDKKGFDIVIGNPPYVRQENITDPLQRWDKAVYKAKLQRSAYAAYPRFFGYKPQKDTDPCNPGKAVTRKIDGKADLYIFFYLHGLSLLNDKGSFCFITSNSWLDVGYGRDLQEFLLRQGHVRLILDNQAKRSFSDADVNTVIALLSAPQDKKDSGLAETARFAMFKVPFEGVLSPVVFEEIEEAEGRMSREEFRVMTVPQQQLLEEGMARLDEEEETPSKKPVVYAAGKWGGKYLRAPDIYWTIMEKGRDKLVRLGDIAEVRRGFTTGANDFFYLDEKRIEQWGIEEQFLKPVIKSPRECKGYVIKPGDLKFRMFLCNLSKNQLRGTVALEYIKWGESKGFHRVPSCSSRRTWYDLGTRRIAPLISPSSVSELPRTFRNSGVYADKRLYEIYPHEYADRIHLVTNSTLSSMFLEIGSRTGLGEGLLDLTVYELADCPIVNPKLLGDITWFVSAAEDITVLSLRDELSNPVKRRLDALVFDALELTQGERDAVYESVLAIVECRMRKAESLK